MSDPLGLNMTGVRYDSWADAHRFGPGDLNGWAFGPEPHSPLHVGTLDIHVRDSPENWQLSRDSCVTTIFALIPPLGQTTDMHVHPTPLHVLPSGGGEPTSAPPNPPGLRTWKVSRARALR